MFWSLFLSVVFLHITDIRLIDLLMTIVHVQVVSFNIVIINFVNVCNRNIKIVLGKYFSVSIYKREIT